MSTATAHAETVQAQPRNVHHRIPSTRIVVMSGGGQRLKRDYLSSAELMGVDATLQKPFEINELLKVLRGF